MKRHWPLWFPLFLVFCGGLDTFEIEERSTSEIPAGTVLEQLIGDLGFGSFLALDITQNQELKNQGVKRHQIDSVRIGAIDLMITDPDDGDFTFMNEVEFFVSAAGLPRVRIARGMDFEPGKRTASLDIDDVELAPYAAAPAMDITTEGKGRRPAKKTTVRAVVTLLVDVNVEGVLCGE